MPELDVSDMDRALAFYVSVVGFEVLYERTEEAFAFLNLGGAQLMLQEAQGPGRRWRTARLEHPYGRGINLQIEVDGIDALYARIRAAGAVIVLEMEEQWYRRATDEIGHRQFVVADPDGYLLRFVSTLAGRPS